MVISKRTEDDGKNINIGNPTPSKSDKVLRHIIKYGSITMHEASAYGILHLSGVISDLCDLGYRFEIVEYVPIYDGCIFKIPRFALKG